MAAHRRPPGRAPPLAAGLGLRRLSAAAPGAADPPPLAVVVGAEYEGVGKEAAEICDARVRIPMSGAMDTTLDSLNVNVAAAIVLERVFTLNRSPDAAED